MYGKNNWDLGLLTTVAMRRCVTSANKYYWALQMDFMYGKNNWDLGLLATVAMRRGVTSANK
jgi:hypothetical protein